MTSDNNMVQDKQAKTNYEIAKERTAKLFLTYDLPAMIKKTGFKADESYIYMNFLMKEYRISLETGLVEYLEDEASAYQEATYSDAMTIYDIICYSAETCQASYVYTAMQNLAPMYNSSKGTSEYAGAGMYDETARLFDAHPEAFEAACKALNGVPFGKGDVSYRIPIFQYNGEISVALDFWCSDEEFPPQLTILCDKNLLQYIHYETVWFMVGFLLGRIKELMGLQ